MKRWMIFTYILVSQVAISGTEIKNVSSPVKMESGHIKCRAKNNAPVEITSSRLGSTVTISIKVLHDLEGASIQFNAVDDLEFLSEPESFDQDLNTGEVITVELKVKPTKHLSYVAVQVEGILHNFPRVKTVTVPVPGTSAFGNLPLELYKRKIAEQNEKASPHPKKKLTRKGRPVLIMNQ